MKRSDWKKFAFSRSEFPWDKGQLNSSEEKLLVDKCVAGTEPFAAKSFVGFRLFQKNW